MARAIGLSELRFAIRLSRRFGRSRVLRRSCAVVAVSSAFLVIMMMVLSALTLTGGQVADRDLGRFGAYAGFGALPAVAPCDGLTLAGLQRAARVAGGQDVMVTLITDSLPVSSRSGQRLTLWEGDWRSEPFPRRMDLTSGRWPGRPGEIVITDPDPQVEGVPVRAGSLLMVPGQPEGLRVVGIADDRFATQTAVLAAPGTWASLPTSLRAAFTTLTAQPSVYWAGNRPDAVLSALETLASPAGSTRVSATYVDRAAARRMLGRSWVERSPAGYLIPLLLLPTTSVLLVAGINDRRHRLAMRLVRGTGVPQRVTAASLTLALLVWTLAAAVVGLAVGGGVGAALRPLVAAANDRPAGQIGDLTGTAVKVVALLLVTGLAVGVRLGRSGAEPRSTPRAARLAGRARGARQLAAVAAWCATALAGVSADSTIKSMIFAGALAAAVLLVTPDVLAATLRRLPERGPRQRLSRRQMVADGPRIAAVTSVLALCLGTSSAFLVLLATFSSSAQAGRYPEVLPGQLRVGQTADRLAGPSEAVLGTVERSGAVEGSTRFEVRTLYSERDGELLGRVSAETAPGGLILTVSSTDQVEAMLGQGLVDRARSALEGGGVVLWAGATQQARTRLLVTDGQDDVVSRSAELPAARITIRPSELLEGSSGVVLTDTARRLTLPTTTQGPVLFTGLRTVQVDRARDAVAAAGLDLGSLSSYVRPAPVLTPVGLTATAGGLVVVGLLVSLFATHAQVRALRAYLSRLVSIGLAPSWARQVVLRQQGLVFSLAAALAVVMAVPPALLNTLRIDGAVLAVPWGQLTVLWSATLLGTLVAAAVAARRIRPGAR